MENNQAQTLEDVASEALVALEVTAENILRLVRNAMYQPDAGGALKLLGAVDVADLKKELNAATKALEALA